MKPAAITPIPMPFPIAPARLALLATEACRLEAAAPKPGNVYPGRSFGDMSYEDFIASGEAAGPELGRAGERPLGQTILAAVEATRRRTAVNTNLGIILLLAPLARAAARPAAPDTSLRERVEAVLRETTADDAALTYQAIRAAAPGGLGRAADQDVSGTPTVTLRAAMALAAGRDAVAREYASGFATTFSLGVPALRQALAGGISPLEAVVEAYLVLLAGQPDTLIERKLGNETAGEVSGRAGEILAAGGVRTPAGRAALAEFDSALRDGQNSRNPGATADLTAAALFTMLVEDDHAGLPSRILRAE